MKQIGVNNENATKKGSNPWFMGCLGYNVI